MEALSGNEVGLSFVMDAASNIWSKQISLFYRFILLLKQAEEEVEHAQTLTGFKWIISKYRSLR